MGFAQEVHGRITVLQVIEYALMHVLKGDEYISNEHDMVVDSVDQDDVAATGNLVEEDHVCYDHHHATAQHERLVHEQVFDSTFASRTNKTPDISSVEYLQSKKGECTTLGQS